MLAVEIDVFFFYFHLQDIVRLTPNIAVRGTATQSSTNVNTGFVASPFVASHAIDGDFDTSMTETSGACSHTENSPPVWWQVDLLEVYEITKVAITGRVQDGKSHYIFLCNSFN